MHHAILFRKTIDVIPDPCWKLLVYWYNGLTVRLKWNDELSDPVLVIRGTRQGGLSSPFIFNVFYQDMVAALNAKCCGINMYGNIYTAYFYADEILLTSRTPSGLQDLIDCANSYITAHGLTFNAGKTHYMVLGKF